jgi:hypothetical protein
MLHFMTGRSWVEIAEMKGQSKYALHKRGARIVEQLRRKFGTRLNPKLDYRDSSSSRAYFKDAQCLFNTSVGLRIRTLHFFDRWSSMYSSTTRIQIEQAALTRRP